MAAFSFIVVAITATILGRLFGGQKLPHPCYLPIADVEASRLPNPRSLGELVNNSDLTAATRLFEGQIHGSESVAVAEDGALWMLDKFGAVFRAEGNTLQQVAYMGPGRPLGFHFDGGGNLIVCDSLKGLVMLENGTQRLVVLANAVSAESRLDPGEPVVYANDLDIARDGTIYFSDSTAISTALNAQGFYDTFQTYMLTMFQGGATGRLLAYSPASGRTRMLAKGLWYANGVALAADESFVAVVETVSMRLHRFWLKGPKAGTLEVFVDRLPGFPDGVSRAADGTFWLALIAPPSPAIKVLPFRALRWVAAWLPERLRPPVAKWGCVLQVSEDGKILRALLDPDGSHVSGVSAVTQHGRSLYLGNLAGDHVSVLQLT